MLVDIFIANCHCFKFFSYLKNVKSFGGLGMAPGWSICLESCEGICPVVSKTSVWAKSNCNNRMVWDIQYYNKAFTSDPVKLRMWDPETKVFRWPETSLAIIYVGLSELKYVSTTIECVTLLGIMTTKCGGERQLIFKDGRVLPCHTNLKNSQLSISALVILMILVWRYNMFWLKAISHWEKKSHNFLMHLS